MPAPHDEPIPKDGPASADPTGTHPPGQTPSDAPQPPEPGADELDDPAGHGPGEPHGDSAKGDGSGVSREQYEAATAERDDLRDKLLRAQAETDNVRKRAAREQSEGARFAAVPLAKAILPGLDDLRRAVEAAKASREAGADPAKLADDLLGGVSATLANLEKALAGQGIEPIPAVGEPFDPNRHEALAQAPSLDHPPGTVIQEAQRGYAAGDRVLRPSQVIVATAAAE